MPTQLERETYVGEIIDAISEANVDIDCNDPGCPDVYITDDIPEVAVACYKPADEETPLPCILIETEAVDHAIKTGKPYNLVDPIIHERRHFKQDCAGAGYDDTLVPPTSAIASLFHETDAYVYTAACMAKLHAKKSTQWMTEIDEKQKTVGQGFLNFQTYIEKMGNPQQSPEQILARMLLVNTGGYFPKDQMFLDLEHKLWQLEEAHKLVRQHGKVGVPSTNWIAVCSLDDPKPYELHPYYKTTDVFSGDDGSFDWVQSEDLIPSVLGKECMKDYEGIMQKILMQHAALQSAIRLRLDQFHLVKE